jgi:hypothetical protein
MAINTGGSGVAAVGIAEAAPVSSRAMTVLRGYAVSRWEVCILLALTPPLKHLTVRASLTLSNNAIRIPHTLQRHFLEHLSDSAYRLSYARLIRKVVFVWFNCIN